MGRDTGASLEDKQTEAQEKNVACLQNDEAFLQPEWREKHLVGAKNREKGGWQGW